METCSSILVWKIPWTEEPSRLYSPWGCRQLDVTEHTHTHQSTFHYIRHMIFDLLRHSSFFLGRSCPPLAQHCRPQGLTSHMLWGGQAPLLLLLRNQTSSKPAVSSPSSNFWTWMKTQNEDVCCDILNHESNQEQKEGLIPHKVNSHQLETGDRRDVVKLSPVLPFH